MIATPKPPAAKQSFRNKTNKKATSTTYTSRPELTNKLPSILLTNAPSLVKKLASLNSYLEDSGLSIAMVTETWLTPNNILVIKNRILKNYNFLSCMRQVKTGGGALILVSKEYVKSCTPIKPKPPELATGPRAAAAKDPVPIAIDLKIAKLDVNQLPGGYSSVIV